MIPAEHRLGSLCTDGTCMREHYGETQQVWELTEHDSQIDKYCIYSCLNVWFFFYFHICPSNDLANSNPFLSNDHINSVRFLEVIQSALVRCKDLCGWFNSGKSTQPRLLLYKAYEDHVFLFAKQYRCSWLYVHLLATHPSDVLFPPLESPTAWKKQSKQRDKQRKPN